LDKSYCVRLATGVAAGRVTRKGWTGGDAEYRFSSRETQYSDGPSFMRLVYRARC